MYVQTHTSCQSELRNDAYGLTESVEREPVGITCEILRRSR